MEVYYYVWKGDNIQQAVCCNTIDTARRLISSNKRQSDVLPHYPTNICSFISLGNVMCVQDVVVLCGDWGSCAAKCKGR
jgi:hypothetical protein